MKTREQGRRAAMRGSAAVRLGVVAAAGVWVGCNAIIGLEPPEHEDLCAGVSCRAVDACHLDGECDPATGACSNPPAPDGMGCDDGDLCTRTDACQGGICVGLEACPAVAGGCQAGCDPVTGLCAAPDGTACLDGDACTSDSTCQGGVCNPGEDRTWAHWVPDTPKRYVVTDDVVVDTTTGRTWQRVEPATSYTWQDAQTYCDGLSLPGFPSGWRLPTRIELVSIVDYTKTNPAIDTGAFIEASSDPFWSLSLFAVDSSVAWIVDFDVGGVYYGVVDYARRVRCVR